MYLNSNALDFGLNWITENGKRIDITLTEATTYAQAVNSLGNAAASVAAPEQRSPDGRKVSVSVVSNGSVTAKGQGNFWALTDGASVLVAAGPLEAPKEMDLGDTFILPAFDIGIPDAS